MFSLAGCCLALFGFLGLAVVGLGGAWHQGWEIGPTGLHDLSPLLFTFCVLFRVDGQLAQVPQMGFYFGRCLRWVYGIDGRACGLSLVFLTPLPWCRLYLDCLFEEECVPWRLGVLFVLVFFCGGEVAWPCFVGR